ncbi:hypothetical protein ACLI4U_04340 [Natrialbaceae archaeon A-CW2]|nr:hypothetical protein [Natronosalvus amylolyticus]
MQTIESQLERPWVGVTAFAVVIAQDDLERKMRDRKVCSSYVPSQTSTGA